MRRGARAPLGALAAALVLGAGAGLGPAACGGDDEDGGERAQPLGETIGGSVAPLVQCRDWVGGSREEQLATIEDIRSQVSRRDTGFENPPTLSDEEATRVFDNACANRFARGFRLYVIYAQAAGFAPLTRGLPREGS